MSTTLPMAAVSSLITPFLSCRMPLTNRDSILRCSLGIGMSLKKQSDVGNILCATLIDKATAFIRMIGWYVTFTYVRIGKWAD